MIPFIKRLVVRSKRGDNGGRKPDGMSPTTSISKRLFRSKKYDTIVVKIIYWFVFFLFGDDDETLRK